MKISNYFQYKWFCLTTSINEQSKKLIKELIINDNLFYVSNYEHKMDKELFTIKHSNNKKCDIVVSRNTIAFINYKQVYNYSIEYSKLSSNSNVIISRLVFNRVCNPYLKSLKKEFEEYKDSKFLNEQGFSDE